MPRRSVVSVENRRASILTCLEQEGYLSVQALSEMLEVSPVTVRRDLDALHASGKIQRRHGGAQRSSGRQESRPEGGEDDASHPDDLAAARRIAAYAASRLSTGDVILLSAGKVSEQIAHLCLLKSDLTIITNSTQVFDILRQNRQIHLVSTGGELRHPHGTLVGPLAEASIREMRADMLMLEPSGISMANTLYCSSLTDVPVLRAMVHASREITVVAEHSVFAREGIMQLGDITLAEEIVADSDLDPSLAANLKKQGVRVVTV